ncbi:MAG: M20/M25/M40 family metallo-hydrolase, partial [Halonotius sp.]
AINSVPASAQAALDIRLTAGVAAPPICDRIRSFLADEDGIEIDSIRWTEGTYERPDAPLVEASVEAASEATDNRVFRRSATGGGDAKTLRNAGISAVEFAIGADTAHSVDEWTSIDALEATATAYTVLPKIFATRQDESGGS